jgi:hypothetical protein
MNSGKRGSLRIAALAALFVVCGACDDRYEILQQRELDLAPVLVQCAGVDGYERTDVLLALIPATPGLVRLGRDIAQVVAVAKSGSDHWVSLAPEQPSQIRPLDYTFSSPSSLELDNPRLLGYGLGGKSEFTDARNNANWVRAGATNNKINIEIGFDTQPLMIRKVSYAPAADGFSVDLDSGATLQVRKKRF